MEIRHADLQIEVEEAQDPSDHPAGRQPRLRPRPLDLTSSRC